MLLALSAISACAVGSIREGVYRDPHDRFTVRVPPDRWQPASLDGATLAFRAPELDAGMALLVECDSPEPGRLPSVARHLFFGLADKRIDHRETVPLADAKGVRTRLRARLDDRPVEVDGITIRRGECLYDFLYVAPPDRFDDGRPDFDTFVKSWTPVTKP
ncbi:MAG: hypothetical protein EHM24_31655 [Acidobacteria bacterium]|nr:MAG: hypothetical protein EHM24_31655 [Acidobacteriota bacterium]